MGTGHVLAGLATSADFRTNLILAETTGIDSANVRLTLYDGGGNALQNSLVTVPRFVQAQINGVVDAREDDSPGPPRYKRWRQGQRGGHYRDNDHALRTSVG